MAKDKNVLLGHSEDNDGIQEYDNALPDWWVGLFLFSIAWAGGYAGWYHFGGQSQTGWYETEMAEAAERWPQREAAFAMTPAAIEAGRELFEKNCVGCHLADLTGSIGPNLTDAVWIHGGEPDQIIKTITEGVPAKGMITWGPMLGPEKISHLTAYILSKKAPAAPTPEVEEASGGSPAGGPSGPDDGAR